MSEKITYFAAGCFWGVEDAFRKTPGVIDAVSGYMGGHTENPSYEDVCNGNTGHAETVQVIYDDEKVSFETLLAKFFEIHNPTTLNRQGPDFGTQYRSAIFVGDEAELETARRMIATIDASGKWSSPVVTETVIGGQFWPAEEYHQRYFEKNGTGFCHI